MVACEARRLPRLTADAATQTRRLVLFCAPRTSGPLVRQRRVKDGGGHRKCWGAQEMIVMAHNLASDSLRISTCMLPSGRKRLDSVAEFDRAELARVLNISLQWNSDCHR